MAYPSIIDPFRLAQDTRAILKQPNVWSKTKDMNLYQTVASTQTVIQVMERNRILYIFDPQERGSSPTRLTQISRNLYSIPILHYYTEMSIRGSDVQDRVDLLTGMKTMGMDEAIADAMQYQRMSHSINMEYAGLCAFLKGVLVASDSTEHLNVFEIFGLTQKVIDFELSNVSLDVRAKCMEVARHIELNLRGDISNGKQAFVSPLFMDALSKHPQVEKAFANTQLAADRLGGDVRNGFQFGGINFVEYNALMPDLAGNTRKFIEDNLAFAFPLGTRDTFFMYYGPPDLNSINMANVAGQEVYALTVPDPLGKCVSLHVESDPLPLCRRPEVLVKLTMS